jgi:hypothetical protein
MDILESTFNILKEGWDVLLELAPWLLLGLSIAGILHVYLPSGFIHRHLGGKRFANIFKAVSIGVPMPLCSCGVIPAAIGLKKDGASNGAATGFLISTPQTGVDSILVSAAFLGWPFAVFKVFSALISGLIGGILVNMFDESENVMPPVPKHNSCCAKHTKKSWRTVFQFGFLELLQDFYKWLIIGIFIAALIGVFIPSGRLADIHWTQGLSGMFIMLGISLPMYICATASVPLAAALITAGMSPGSALVLLMAGPTTNVATLGAVYRSFGKKVLVIYLLTVATMSITLGLLFDNLLINIPPATQHMHALPGYISISAAVVLLALMGYISFRDLRTFFRKHPESCCCKHDS